MFWRNILHFAIKTSAFDWLNAHLLLTWKTAALWPTTSHENGNESESNAIKISNLWTCTQLVGQYLMSQLIIYHLFIVCNICKWIRNCSYHKLHWPSPNLAQFFFQPKSFRSCTTSQHTSFPNTIKWMNITIQI